MKKILFFPLLILICFAFAACGPDSRTGSEKDREALFNYIIEKTIERESVSEPKTWVMNYDPLKEMLAFREEMIAADNDEELFRVLMKMSNVRRDRHAVVDPVDNGLVVDTETDRSAPLLFQTDYGVPGSYFFFVGDYSEDISDYAGDVVPETGDKLLAVNNTDIDEYIEELRLYMRYSSYNGLWRQMAEHITRQNFRLPVPLDREEVTFTLENSNGDIYDVTLPYIDRGEIEWQGHYLNHGDNRYSGFEKTISTECYDLYEHESIPVLVLDWYGFRGSLIEDVDKLMDYAQENGLLGYDVIFDGTRSRGGSNGAYLIQRLFSEPFRVTYGNMKLSDLTPVFIEDRVQAYEENRLGGTRDGGTWQIEWLTTDVKEAWERGDNFSKNVPHKCAHLPKDSDGVLQPAEVRFRGNVVTLMGPYGGSHLDQYASMVADNRLGPVIGMPAGGFSSTWEFGEILELPLSGQPLAYFEWGMGNTIRPNVDHPVAVVDMYGRYYGEAMNPDGVVLEGNPPPVDHFIPVTRENYLNYYEILMEEAIQLLGR